MDFGTVEVEKGELAAWVTGALGLLSDGPGDRLGVAHLGRGGMLIWSPPLSPRRAPVRALSAPRPRAAPQSAAGKHGPRACRGHRGHRNQNASPIQLAGDRVH